MSGAQGRFTSPDAPFNDQSPSDPQSWNLYSYTRNNPLRFIDPTGTTCVANVGGDGSVTGYTDVDGPGGTCADAQRGDAAEAKNPHTVVNEATDDLMTFVSGVARAGAVTSPQGIATFYGASIVAGAAVASGLVVTASAAELTTLSRATAQLASALKAAQEAWKRIPLAQREAAMEWLSKIKPGAPSPGPLTPGANIDALKAYRDLAVRVIENGTDGVGTQRLRVEAINKALGQ